MGLLHPLAASAAPHLARVPVAVAVTAADQGVLRVLAVFRAGRGAGQVAAGAGVGKLDTGPARRLGDDKFILPL